jgi:hypothetical protein
MSPGLDRLRSAGLVGALAAVLALMVLERASARQPGGVGKQAPHTRWGNPTILGTIQPLDNVVKVLAATNWR